MMGSYGVMVVGSAHVDLLKMSIFYTLYIGAKIRYLRRSIMRPILKGTLPFLKRKCPSSKYSKSGSPTQISLNRHHYYISSTDSKLQFTLLHMLLTHQDVVEIYITPTFHIILQSLETVSKISNNQYVTSL